MGQAWDGLERQQVVGWVTNVQGDIQVVYVVYK